MRLPYNAAKLLLPVFFPLLCRWEIKGERGPLPRGPVVVAANHLANFDIPLLMIALPRRISFMAEEELFRFPLGTGFRLFDSFPVRRGAMDKGALGKAAEVLKQEDCVLGMFPEGRKSPKAQLQRGYPGTAQIALRNDAYILPVALTGTERVKDRITSLSSVGRRPLATVTFGQPFKLARPSGSLSHAQLKSCTDAIMYKLAELLPEEYRGEYKLGEREIQSPRERTYAAVSR
jgi:1-acyl-sn-glycerol-3-phosphate acyltransferase